MPKLPRSTWFLAAGFWLAAAPAWAGDGRFAPAGGFPVPDPRSVAVGDFDEDGRPDLAVVSRAEGLVAVRLSRPGAITVNTAPEVNCAVTSAAAPAAVVSNSRWTCGSAGSTITCETL